MGAIDELRDDTPDTNALIPLALGLLARARPLLSALRAAATSAGSPAPPPTSRGEALRYAVLGYVALVQRVEAVIEEEAARRPAREAAAEPAPRPQRRDLLR